MSQRLPRVRRLIMMELGTLIQREIEFRDGLVSIHDVDLTPDLKQCHVYVGVVGGERAEKKALELLDKNRASLQRKLMQRITLKNTPHLHFKIDHSVERGVHTLLALEEIDREEAAGDEQEPTDDDPKT